MKYKGARFNYNLKIDHNDTFQLNVTLFLITLYNDFELEQKMSHKIFKKSI